MAITGPEIEGILTELKTGDCWCSIGIGNPMRPDHSAPCLHAQRLLADKPWEHSGHPNYETWVTGLWLRNDETPYHQVCSLMTLQEDADLEPHQMRLNQQNVLKLFLGQHFEALEYLILRHLPELEGRWEWGLWRDLLGHALQAVDYPDLIQAWTEE